jgi:hypothetical protein
MRRCPEWKANRKKAIEESQGELPLLDIFTAKTKIYSTGDEKKQRAKRVCFFAIIHFSTLVTEKCPLLLYYALLRTPLPPYYYVLIVPCHRP